MFRNTFREDPFFSAGGFPDIDSFFDTDIERPHRRHRDGQRRNRPNNAMEPFGGGMFDIFGDMNQMMSQMQRRFNDVHQQMQHGESGSNPNGHCYTSSTFYSYDSRGNEPHIYQAHSSSRTAPGGIRETRKALKDSRTGEEKMAIGQHINERGVIREKRRNRKRNEEDEKEDLIGIGHDELPNFTREWEEKVPRYQALGADGQRFEGRRGRKDARALPDGRRY